ncbi:LysR family transcriptional regulator [Jannaschia pohangensis]|uniref:LysR family transcriptional regulator, glycine cleavage system transcriptional activator n=1 Tax=Jannaschia pohangensis TaxID=390807 RepID=A0A1I3QBQ0_9RHOB|nr:LysR family transcriptional regulator [Jannaschia pohangensis]SFJ31328.1 LysR family transcriptional regulator, glycine cleavage system transcriptional activator [Jannaschia pohangensis]
MNWKDVPPLAALRAFEAAARHRSLSEAASELNVTHAAIGQHVRKLEALLSQSLVVRQGRGIAVTPTGLQLADALTDGFGTIAEAVAALRNDAETRPLVLSVTPAFATNWLMPRIGDFWTRHPDIPLNISPSIDILDLRRDGIDMAIRHGAGQWPGLDVELLTDGQYWVVAHPRLMAGRTANCLQDVADLPWLLEHYMMERRAMIEQEGIDLEQVRIQLMATNWMVLSAAQAGHGLTVQPKSLVDRQVEAGDFVKICELSSGPLAYYIVTQPDQVSPRLRKLRRWLHEQAAVR